MGFQLNLPVRQMKPFSFTFCVSSTDDSVPSSDSLSDSSPPAPGVPTQVVQSVQTTPQVRCTHIFIMMGIPLYVGDNVDTNEHTTHTVGLLFDQDFKMNPVVPVNDIHETLQEIFNFQSDALALYINRGQCCKPCLRQPRGIRQATSTIYSLCI